MNVLLLTHIYPYWGNRVKGSFVAEHTRQLNKADHFVGPCVVRNKWLYLLLMPLKIIWHRCFTGFDIIHSHFGVPSGFVGALFKYKTPLIVTIFGAETRNWLAKMLLPFVVRRADEVICVSEYLRQRVEEICGPSKKIVVLHNAVDTQFYRKTIPFLREQLGLPQEAIVISVLCNLIPLKRVDWVIKACNGLLAKFNAYLLIGGNGTEARRLEWLAESNSDAGRVYFLGQLWGRDKSILFSRSEICVSASATEGHSISVLEAMACENAMILSDIPPHRETIEEGREGFLVKDIKKLREHLMLLLQDESIRKGMQKQGRRRVVKDFDWAQRVKKIKAIYAKHCNTAA